MRRKIKRERGEPTWQLLFFNKIHLCRTKCYVEDGMGKQKIGKRFRKE
jgi:hypothetical protein